MPNLTNQWLRDYEARRRVQTQAIGTHSGEGSDEPEAGLQESIENYLKSLGQRCWYDRNRMDKPTTGRKGIPDFRGWIDGRPFAIECKRKGQKPTSEQTGELLWAAKAGAITGVAYSLQDFIALTTPTPKGE